MTTTRSGPDEARADVGASRDEHGPASEHGTMHAPGDAPVPGDVPAPGDVPVTRDPTAAGAAADRPEPHGRWAGRGVNARRTPSTALLAGIGLALLVGALLVAVLVGPAHLTPSEVWSSVRHHVLGAEPSLSPLRDAIVWEGRLPRALTAAAVGAGLAVCGVVMQALTRNPLADPYLLGLSSGASLGAVSVLLLGIGLLLPVAAFAGAALALVASLTLAGALGALTPTRTVLAGLAVSQLCAAATSLVIFWSAEGDSYREVLTWLMGSVAGAGWSAFAIAGVALVVLGLPLAAAGNVLDAMTFGDHAATALGIPVGHVRWTLLGGVALLTGALVSVSGAIGFVGLVLPHAVRAVVGSRHRAVLPLSAVLGALVLVLADTLARTAFEPRELPVGVVTAALGAPAFAWLLHRTRKTLA